MLISIYPKYISEIYIIFQKTFRNIYAPVRALLVCFRNRHQIKTFLPISPHPSLYCRPHIWKKVSLTVFRQKFCQNFACGAYFYFHNHDLFEKVHLELNPLIQRSVQQDYVLQLHPLPLYHPDCIPPFTKRQ